MDKIAEKMYELVEHAKRIYGRDYSDVKWTMNGRLTSTAGRAFITERRMDFSTKLYAENPIEFIEDTVGHEFAHIVAWDIYQDRGHGIGWKHVVNSLGIATERCHSYKVEKKVAGGSLFKCACRTHSFTPQRMAWVRKGKVYRCRDCKELLVEVV